MHKPLLLHLVLLYTSFQTISTKTFCICLFISPHTGTLPDDLSLFHTLLYPEFLQIHLVYVHIAGFLDRRTYILYYAAFLR
mgnify:FL=1